jgi:phosphonate transport system ATP-binding protein
VVKIEALQKTYNGTAVLKDISLTIQSAEGIALIGPSGSGKTTLIRSINGFVVPDQGIIWVDGKQIDHKAKKQLRETRKRIGMIYQLFNLVERRSAIANVLTGALGRLDRGLPFFLSVAGWFNREEREKALGLLRFVGLEERADERVDRLSGGEKQRVAIARALMQEPDLLLADEPVANLDPKSSHRILDLLLRVNQEKRITLVTVLHHLGYVRDHFDRVVALKEGQIRFDGDSAALTQGHLSDIYAFDEEMPFEPSA